MTYENAISICETKIEEKRDEADSLLTKLKELKDVQESLKIEQEASLDESLSQISGESVIQPDGSGKDGADTEAMKSVMLQKLESKKNDLAQAEGIVGEIHSNEMKLERLNSLWRRYESFNVEGNAARNRFKRTNSDRGFGSEHEAGVQFIPSIFNCYKK